MRTIEFECDGKQFKEVIYNIDDFPYDNYKEHKIVMGKRTDYIDLVSTFDIECYTVDSKTENPYGFMYIWQFCLDDDVVMGRTWKDLLLFFKRLRRVLGFNYKTHLVTYIHNESYEFQFMKDFFQWDSVFAKDKRKPLKAVTKEGIEFRCSYYLSNMSLEAFCNYSPNCVHKKLSGQSYRYKKLRTPSTYMEDFELAYCYCDVKGLAESIKDMLADDTLATIPMTSTGFVRRDCRRAMRTTNNRKLFEKTALTVEQYELLEDVKRGGNTHAYRGIVGTILHNVRCFDIASSYPYQMMCEYFPMTGFVKIGTVKRKSILESYLDKYCCMFRLTLTNVNVKDNVPIPYIPVSKCTSHTRKKIQFNGRILSCEGLTIACTEIDYRIIMNQYTYSEIGIEELYIAERGVLPIELKQTIMTYFLYKTTLKNVDDYLYAKSKNKLNAIFGMTCTNPVYDDIIYDNDSGEWRVVQANTASQLEKYYNSRNSFLPIQWGVWVTAHARNWLQKAIDISGTNTCYCDTDSDKVQGMEGDWLSELNCEAIEKCKKYGAYVDHNGKRYYMGVFEEETPYDEFRTWGAKKYASVEDGELHLTVAGVDKKYGADELGDIKKFNIGFRFKKSGGKTSWYNDLYIHDIIVNGERIETASNIGILDSTYTLGITQEFAEIIDEPIYDYL